MNKRVKYIFLLMLIFCGKAENALSQNLVPNWSFEEYNDSCTNNSVIGLFENVKDWLPKLSHGFANSVNTFQSPDYYSSCIPFFLNYPPIIFYGDGFQYPYDQGSFVALGVILNPGNEYRESIRIQLKQKLKQGLCYHAEMYCNKDNSASYVYNKLGMVFTVDSFPMQSDGSLPYPTPQIYTNDFVYDTLNWVKIEGEFTSQGDEEWLTIGWMFDINQISADTVLGGSNLPLLYYYIDAVKVYPCADDEEALILYNLISPNGDGKNDFYVIDSLPPNSHVSFFNRWGNEIYSSDNYQNEWDGTYMGQPLPAGTYYVVVQMPHGTRKSTFIELVY